MNVHVSSTSALLVIRYNDRQQHELETFERYKMNKRNNKMSIFLLMSVVCPWKGKGGRRGNKWFKHNSTEMTDGMFKT